MRKPTKIVAAVTLAIAALSVTALAAAAGSNGSGNSSGASGPTKGSIRVDPPVHVPPPCGEQSADGTGPDGTVSYVPCPGDGPTLPVPTPVVPTPGMDNVHPRGWDSSTVSDDGTAVTLTYYTGVPPCTALDHVDVRYGTDTVTITLYEGSDPSAQGTACIDIAMLASTTVHLDQPLGGRTIVDGVAG